ncbi:DUF4012 domain-containing protein [Nocardioides marmoriginsengisoli]|uniref:DUF4012 domain-containing protein n=1 Tax=Nocardioides marmoriginsengisoli TaxID=661483 RepID=A0A3N0CAX6_9ACTN|nr:DUF4012 domain-containing protein [Nocardioides marmoriginsengisoli]RNL60624.1 DUF4012 domain-containing protein [Nocardioides marmoriginsengisoli]
MGNTQILTRRKVVIGLVVLVAFIIGLFVWQAFSASFALKDARTHAEAVQQHIRAGDFDAANRSLAELQEDTDRAHSRTGGVLWDVAKHVPYFGRNVRAVQTVSEVLDTATEINGPIALQLSKALDDGVFRPQGGKINLAEIAKLTPNVRRAATSIDKAGRDLDEIRVSQLTFPFNDLIGDLQDQVDRARSAATATATAFDLMPEMLGSSEPRNYLLMIQNPAEVRSTGGLPGSLAILHAEGGKLTMGWQGSAGDINPFSGPVVKLPADTEQMYGPSMATDFRDINFTPDFPEAAQVARSMVKQKLNVNVDGVVSVDPIALSNLMLGTGPIPVAGVPLKADNVVAALLNATYKNLQNAGEQDQFFEGAAKEIFNAVMSGRGDQAKVIKGLADSAVQHRVLLWSAREDEQARLDGTAVGGGLPGDTGSTPQVGMYLNDTLAGKMDYYLEYRASVAAVDCRQNGSQDLRATMALSSKVPKNYQDLGLGVYILGNGQYAPQGTIAFNLRIYGSAGGEITGLKINGVDHSITADEHNGRQVAFLPVALKPGEVITVTADIRTAGGADGDGVFSFTPGMVATPNGMKITSACG